MHHHSHHYTNNTKYIPIHFDYNLENPANKEMIISIQNNDKSKIGNKLRQAQASPTLA